ncbi:MAG: hypothetical protein KDB23_12395 [Planctomycetales bacterium]|nr:hypothetical protein [Planctomycetales bacterium]
MAEEMPRSAALDFVSRKKGGGRTTPVTATLPMHEESVPNSIGSPPTTQIATATGRVYDPFTTRVRRDIKRQLKRLSYHREETGHEVRSVQQFVELALTEWLERQEDSPGWAS